MIGQAGTGSPEAGVVLRVVPRVLVYTLRTGTGTRQATQGPRTDSGVQSAVFATAPSPWHLFCMVANQVSVCWESDSPV